MNNYNEINKIGFVSTRFAGTDGVSLEAAKWAEVFERLRCKCFYFAGELDRSPDISYHVNSAHFSHPQILDITRRCFAMQTRDRSLTDLIYKIKEELKEHLYKFIQKFNINILVPENTLAIPVNIPLGLALTEVFSETGIKTIAHHHDFFWERQRFMFNCVWDYLNTSFPPHLPNIDHVVINSSADNQLSLRTGISSTIIPNVMDFDIPPYSVCNNKDLRAALCIIQPEKPDNYNDDVRKDLGIKEDELFVLQPTRIVKRKGIEHSIELIHRLESKAKLVISHASGDEGDAYEQRVRNYSRLMKVDTIFVSDIIAHKRGRTPDGRKIYTLHDIYPHADLVTYPSNFEGFGNAFLEAIYFCKPVVVNNYSIYSLDIKPKGFDVIEINGYISEQAVTKTKDVLNDPQLRKRMIIRNYEIGKRYFSYDLLYRKLNNLLRY